MIPIIMTMAEAPDDQAFLLHLYNTHQRLMMATALKCTNDVAAAEDIVHDSVVRLIGKIDLLRTMPESVLAGYIATTVRNVAIDHLRRQAAELRRSAEMPDEDVPDTELTMDELVMMAERRESLLAVWPKLSEDDRLVLEGKYILGYSDRELAEMLGCREVTVRVKLTRARKKCSRLLGKEAAENDE